MHLQRWGLAVQAKGGLAVQAKAPAARMVNVIAHDRFCEQPEI
jgi:hypothetical protein